METQLGLIYQSKVIVMKLKRDKIKAKKLGHVPNQNNFVHVRGHKGMNPRMWCKTLMSNSPVRITATQTSLSSQWSPSSPGYNLCHKKFHIQTEIVCLYIINQLVFINRNECFFNFTEDIPFCLWTQKQILCKSYRPRYHKFQCIAFHFMVGFCNTGLTTVP